MKKNQYIDNLYITAAIITILGAFARLFDIEFAQYVFSLGVVLLIFLHGKNVFDKVEKDNRRQRLDRIGLFTSLMLAIAAYLMFTGSNSWVAFVLIYALSTFFQSFRGK
jgi:hypothetical protein